MDPYFPEGSGSGPSPLALLLAEALPLQKGCFLLLPLPFIPKAVGEHLTLPTTSAARRWGFPGLPAGTPAVGQRSRGQIIPGGSRGGLSPLSSPAQPGRPSEADPAAAALLEMSSVPLGRAANLRRAELFRCLPKIQDGIYARGEEWVHEGKEDGSRGGSSEPRVDLGNPRGARGAGKMLLQGVTGFSGTEGSGASQALGCRPWPRGAGWVQAASSPHSVPLLAAPVPAVAPRGAPMLSVPGQGRRLHPAPSTKPKPATQQLAVKVKLS